MTNLKNHLTEDFVVEHVDMFEQNEYTKIFNKTLADKLERIATELFVKKPKNIRKFKILERLINRKIELVRSKISDLTIDLEDISSDIKEASDGTILSLRKGRVKNIYLSRLVHQREETQEERFRHNQANEIETLKLIRIELEEYLILTRRIARLQKKRGKMEGFFTKYEPQFGGNVKRK